MQKSRLLVTHLLALLFISLFQLACNAATASFATLQNVPGSTCWVALGDYDADGRLDLVVNDIRQ